MKLAPLTIGLLLTTTLFGTSVTARAQTAGPETQPRTFGTSSETVHAVSAVEFSGQYGNETVEGTTRFARSCAGSDCDLVAGARLPAGALVTRIELDACMNGNGVATARLIRSERLSPSPVTETLASVSTSEFDFVTPACTNFPRSLVAIPTINHRDHYYVLQVSLSADNAFLLGVRLYYRLQVSPGPAIATFHDVPTGHAFFPFVEALAKAGITGGCGGGNFCPDNPVTRGQMAKFLSTALGLHFAP